MFLQYYMFSYESSNPSPQNLPVFMVHLTLLTPSNPLHYQTVIASHWTLLPTPAYHTPPLLTPDTLSTSFSTALYHPTTKHLSSSASFLPLYPPIYIHSYVPHPHYHTFLLPCPIHHTYLNTLLIMLILIPKPLHMYD